MLHPIHYSMLLNVLVLAIAGGLAFFLSNPIVFVVGCLLCNHMVGRFGPEEDLDELDSGGASEPRAGFLADVDRE